MLCYRDMTFCPFHANCADAPKCSRPLTDEVKERAAKARLDVAVFVEKPQCHRTIEPGTPEQEQPTPVPRSP